MLNNVFIKEHIAEYRFGSSYGVLNFCPTTNLITKTTMNL